MEIKQTHCRELFDSIIDYSHGRLEIISYGFVVRGIEGIVKDTRDDMKYKIVIEPDYDS